MSDARFEATALVVPFEKLRMTDVESVGGKNASLGEMISQLAETGVRVPGGFEGDRHDAAHDGSCRFLWAARGSVHAACHPAFRAMGRGKLRTILVGRRSMM